MKVDDSEKIASSSVRTNEKPDDRTSEAARLLSVRIHGMVIKCGLLIAH